MNTVDPGNGWRLLDAGEPLQSGDGFLHPDMGGSWLDYCNRPDIFRGAGRLGNHYYVPQNETAHTYPWRRKTE